MAGTAPHRGDAGVFAIGLFVSVAVLTFSKDPLVFAALTAFAFLYRAMPGRQLRALALVFLGVVVSLFVLLPAFSVYRGTGTLALIAPSDLNMRLISSDAQGPFSVLAVMVDRSPQFPMPSLIEFVFLWVPRAIWPDRPFDAAEAFAQALVPDWQPGVGRGFSAIRRRRRALRSLAQPADVVHLGGDTRDFSAINAQACGRPKRSGRSQPCHSWPHRNPDVPISVFRRLYDDDAVLDSVPVAAGDYLAICGEAIGAASAPRNVIGKGALGRRFRCGRPADYRWRYV